MTDLLLRRLERAATSDRCSASGARLLAERLRAGELDRDRVRLAAQLGDAAAQAVVGEVPPRHVETWVMGFAPWGHEVCVRVAVAAARAALPVYEDTFLLSTLCRDVLRAADDWLDSGGQAPAPALIERPVRGGRRVFGAASAAMRVAQAIRAETTDLHPRQRKRYRSKAETAARFAFLAVQDARSAIELEAVRDAVRLEVAPWAIAQDRAPSSIG